MDGDAAGPPDEKELVERYLRGDGPALEALVGRYEGLLRARILQGLPRAVRRRVSVQDILQETRIAAFESRGTFESRGEGAFGGWLLGIAENRVRRAVERHAEAECRSVDREVDRDARPDTGQFADGGATPSEEAMAGELEEMAREALGSLDPEEREVLRLARDGNLSMADTAARMGRSVHAARRLYARALERFREALDRLRGA